MKRKALLSFITIISFSSATIAQIPKGSTLLGGSIGFINTKTKTAIEQKGTNVTIAPAWPAWGTAVKENTFVGVSLNYNFLTNKNGSANAEQKISGYGAGFFVRKYIPLITRLYLFGDASIGFFYGTQKQNDNVSEYESKSWGIGLGLQPGVSFAATDKIHLEIALNNLAGISYSHTKSTSTNIPGIPTVSKTDALSIGGNLGSNTELRVGIRFLIVPKS
jgi:hypothetical protein